MLGEVAGMAVVAGWVVEQEGGEVSVAVLGLAVGREDEREAGR